MLRFLLCWLLAVLSCVGCKRDAGELATGTTAELRSVKGKVEIRADGKTRAPYPRDRLKSGDVVVIPEGGLTWMRRDGGATWLIAGPGEVTLREAKVKVSGGRAFVDTEQGEPVVVETPSGDVELSGARVSLEIGEKESTAYVLRGSARGPAGRRAQTGEVLTLSGKRTTVSPVLSWQDWTGGLGTADPSAAPAPFGIGTVGARKPGEKGTPRASLVIERLDVKVTIDHDIAFTEVDQTFVNPTSETVEGIFRFRTPKDATLSQFAVDRDGKLVFGRVRESRSATQVYESHVYEGGSEDPALLSWESPGVYSARLYPILKGAKRRVVTRYSQWLTRQGTRGERRVYIYPMAASGAKGSLPRIEEMAVKVDVRQAGAERIVSGMHGVKNGDEILVKASDFVPQADLAIELFDGGSANLRGYRAPHAFEDAEIPEGRDVEFAREVEKTEADYVAIPLRIPDEGSSNEGIDLAIVVDTSAATESAALAISRSFAEALLSHLGPQDRAALFTGDSTLRPAFFGSEKFTEVTDEVRKKWLGGLSSMERGGATDLGALVTNAAASLDPKRASAVVYVGDGAPSVGEIAPQELRERLARFPASTRIVPVAVGSQPNVTLLEVIARGASVEVVEDAYGAARVALSVLESVARPTWLGARVDLGSGVDRVLPEVLPPLAAGETVMIVGRLTGKLPDEVLVKSSRGESRHPVTFERLEDRGDLRRRWGTIRLHGLMAEGAGRATLVDLSERYGLVSPFTSLYVPTRAEEEQEDYHDEMPSYEDRQAKLWRWKPWAHEGGFFFSRSAEAPLEASASVQVEQYLAEDNKEGGTGIRAKGEDGSMGREEADPDQRYAVQGPTGGSAPPIVRQSPSGDASGFGMAFPGAPPASAPAPAPEEERAESASAEAAKSVAPTVMRSKRAAGRSSSCSPGDPMCAGLGSPVENSPSDVSGMMEATVGGSGFGLSGTGSIGVGRPSGSHSSSTPSHSTSESIMRDDLPTETTLAPRKVAMGSVGHRPVPCGAGADLPLSERRVLWMERLSGVGVTNSVRVYSMALRNCEATNWRERVALLVLMVDSLPNVVDRVNLWRALVRVSPGAADAVYRFLVLRVRTAGELHELHEALGFQQIEPEVLKSLLSQARTPAERLTLLRATAEQYPDDSELGLGVLDAYEDAGDEAGGRAWARKLRRRVDATSHLRTNVGEYYLRLAKKGGASAARDESEGRRTFGEIVEFAPEDPLSRRHLGDLLLAHGWYDEALGQYQTLEKLTPEDPTVKLLLARAAHGTGKTELAVRLSEQAAAAGAPDGSEPVTVAARAFSSVFLAEARLLAHKEKSSDELARLRGRAARLARARGGVGRRVILTWSHPELRAVLWTNALGTMMPAADHLALLSIAEAYVPTESALQVELRLDPEDAQVASRLGLKAQLFVVTNEGEDEESIAASEVNFSLGEGNSTAGNAREGKAREIVKLTLTDGRLIEVTK